MTTSTPSQIDVRSTVLGIGIGVTLYHLYNGIQRKNITHHSVVSSNNIAVHVDTTHPLYNATIDDLHQYMNTKRYTSVDIIKYYLQQITLIDRELKSIICVESEAKLLQQAQQLDLERSQGKLRGLLHGIPILVKDNVDTVGMATTAGSTALKNNVPNKDATLIQYMKQHGGIVLGKTNMTEWANFRSAHSVSGWSALGGQCKNPYAYDRNTSGSSSGSGASVAAGLCIASLGSETDGSIVSPCNNTGLVGIKPTVGLVSRTGVIPVSSTQDTVGPMCKTVKDAAYVLSAISGVDSSDSATAAAKQWIHKDYTKFCDLNGLQGARIGVLTNLPGFRDTQMELFHKSVEIIKQAGATVIELEFPNIEHDAFAWNAAEETVLLYDFKHDLNAYLADTDPSKVSTRTLADVIKYNKTHKDIEMPTFPQTRFEDAQSKGERTDQKYIDAKATCTRMAYTDGIQKLLKTNDLDCLVSPTGGTAWLIDHINADAYPGSNSSICAVALTPHITVPMGNVHGLPMGISFMGDKWTEDKLIKIAYAYEQKTKYRQLPRYLRHTEYPIEL